MPNNSSNASLPNSFYDHPVPGQSTNRSNIVPFSCLSSGVQTYCTPSSSTMSAAAAAAFLLQAATGGSVNGDGSNTKFPTRRTSASNFFDSPKASPSFPTSVISAAAHQAAIAAVQAIGSSQSSSNAKVPSDLQAAVISLALAANPSPTNQSPAYVYEQHDRSYPSQAVTDFFLLSERRPDLLTSHPTLASVFRRRSSTILPTYLTDISHVDSNVDSSEKSALASDCNTSQTLVSALEALTSRHPNFGFAESSLSPLAVNRQDTVTVDNDSGNRDNLGTLDSYCPLQGDRLRCNQISSANEPSIGHPKKGISVITSSEKFGTRASKEVPRVLSLSSQLTSPSLIVGSTSNANNPCSSPVSSLIVNDAITTQYHSSSPLSYSSPSNAATPRLNISPIPSEDRIRGGFLGPCSQLSSKPLQQSFHSGCLNSQDVKTEYSLISDYKDEPNRKREQRLLKNREAARECRRKKKEYVKCLESRVSLLESQNQQLIEELQKVKALCFNELCGLGMNNPTAAAVLAAVTSISGTSTIGDSFASTTSKYSSYQSGDHISEGSFSAYHSLFSEADQPSCPVTPISRGRAKRRSVVATSTTAQLSVTPSVHPPESAYGSQYTGKMVCDDPSSHPLRLKEVAQKDSSQPCRSVQSSNLIEPAIVGGLPISYNTELFVGETCHQQDHIFRPQAFSDVSRANTRRVEQAGYPPNSSVTSDDPCNESVNYFMQPHSATKRSFHRSVMHTDEKQIHPEVSPSNKLEYGSDPKCSRSSNSVPDAAVILAAAAAMVAKSDSPSLDPRLSL